MPENRRKFTRIQFRAEARLTLPSGEFGVEVLDLSLKGALVLPKTEVFTTVGSNGTLKIGLADTDNAIEMDVTIVHREGGYFGLACREIDLDSVTHLRRLVELNVGDESVLQRELTALTKSDA